MFINVSSTQFSPLELNDYVDRYVIDRLSTIDGVARAQVFGAPRYSMRIWLDREAMAARGVTVDDVEAALRRQNVEMPAGSLESASVDFTVRADRTYRSPEDFARFAVVCARRARGWLCGSLGRRRPRRRRPR
jgi:Cation/multidrug efflux pump